MEAHLTPDQKAFVRQAIESAKRIRVRVRLQAYRPTDALPARAHQAQLLHAAPVPLTPV